MKNRKAAERDQLVYEFGILVSPLVDLCRQSSYPAPNEYRIAIAKIQAGDRAWRETAKQFTTFAKDIVFNAEYNDISHVPERLWQRLKPHLEDPNLISNAFALQKIICHELERAEGSFFELLSRVPVEWEPVVFDANTPFTSYIRIKETISTVRARLHYLDRYVKPEFFSLFLQFLRPDIEVRIVTTASGVAAIRDVSDLFRNEYRNYQLLQIEPSDLHDRNLRVDDQIFTLGPGFDRAGMALTNFGPADSSAESHARFDGLIQQARVIHAQ